MLSAGKYILGVPLHTVFFFFLSFLFLFPPSPLVRYKSYHEGSSLLTSPKFNQSSCVANGKLVLHYLSRRGEHDLDHNMQQLLHRHINELYSESIFVELTF